MASKQFLPLFILLFIALACGCAKNSPCYSPEHSATDPGASYTAEEVRILTPLGYNLPGKVIVIDRASVLRGMKRTSTDTTETGAQIAYGQAPDVEYDNAISSISYNHLHNKPPPIDYRNL